MLTGFIRYFFRVLWHIKVIIVMLVTLMVAGAGALTLFEKMPFGDTLYFAFVTGLIIGYGDIVVKSLTSRRAHRSWSWIPTTSNCRGM